MGIRDKPIAPGAPWQNAYAERLIGTIRRECLDHVIVLGESHLRGLLAKFAAYYNQSRIHQSLDKDSPFHRAIERVGVIASQPLLGGLHHALQRIDAPKLHDGVFTGELLEAFTALTIVAFEQGEVRYRAPP